MAFVACDKDGTEAIFFRKPIRGKDGELELWLPDTHRHDDEGYVNLPSGTIEKIIGRPLTWADEPVMI